MLPILSESLLAEWIAAALLVLALAEAGEEDPTVATEIRAGNREAFRQFFNANHEMVYRYLRGRGLSAEISSDAVQQAFIVLWEKRAGIKSGTSLRAYVFKIAYRRALNELRAQRHDGMEESSAGPDGQPQGTAGGYADSTDHVLLMERFDSELNRLPERRRLVFELCFVHGYTYREAAAVLEVSVKTVENQMGHALKALRSAFAAYRESES